MQANEIRDLSEQELGAKLQNLVETLFNLRFQHKTAQLENTGRLKQVRRDIARIQTIKRQRNIG
ncbi:MAG: 50S ribosomal protein L29 [Desulfosalsimonadaceae bacterium]